MIEKSVLINRKDAKKLSISAISSFILTLTLSFLLIGIIALNRSNIEKLNMEQLILEKCAKVNEVISKLLHKTQGLSALVVNGDDKIENFERVAATMIDDPAILNILIAPSGVVSHVYPLQGNEAVIGYNLLGDGDGNKEAVMAKESGQLVFGGPFDLIQGGQALVGRLPVFVKRNDKIKDFWGLVSVTLKYPQVLDGVGLDVLKKQGFTYEIWRINPDNNEKQIISSSGNNSEKGHYVEKRISILNANWYFRISNIRTWYQYPETWVMIFIGICISVLVSFIIQNNYELKRMKLQLENMAHIDLLTNIFNRRHFMELASMNIEKSLRTGSNCFVVIFDVDHFKKVNDSYGHLAGDEVLRCIALRAKNTIRSYDLLGRYGGEEFIILVSDVDKTMVQNLTERIRVNIAETPFEFEGIMISVSASFGVALATPVNNLEVAIKLADKALYRAKEEGRNRVMFDNIINADMS